MVRRVRGVAVLAAVLGLAGSAAAGEAPKPGAAMPAPPPEAPSPAFDRLKALAGEWEGTAAAHGQKAMPTRATVKVVSAGSAVMLITDPGTPHEMVTMFHRDDDALVATHYCSAMNQPRMRAQPGTDPARIAFEFVDGTNLGAHPAHMQKLVLTSAAPDRHLQEWTFAQGDRTETMVFDMTRKR